MHPAGNSSAEGAALSLGIQRYFEVALYLLVLAGFGTLASTGGLDLATVLVVGAAIVYRGYNLLRQRTVLIPERWTTVLTLTYVAFYLADYLLISRGFLGATVHLVLFVMVVRLFSTLRDRDYYFLAVISFLMVLAAAVLTVDSTFLLAFAGFLLAAVATFILMEMRRSARQATVRAQARDAEGVNRNLVLSLAKVSPALVVLILLAAGGIFFVLPRISSGYLSAFAPGSEISTGFSEEVRLGRIGQIQQSNALVMHILIDGDPNGAFDLKWRGVALSDFDGITWSNPHTQRVLPRLPGGSFRLSPAVLADPAWVLKHRRSFHYRVLMEPISSDVFFLASIPYSLEGDYRAVAIDGGGAVFDLDGEHPVSRYEATSNLERPAAAELRSASAVYPSEVRQEYLQLPPIDERITPLARQIAGAAANNYDKAASIEAYLRTHYGYTLQLSRTPPRDPIADFLFERKQGHCEYFASAMAVMLRTLGIPARIVNGFRTGEFNDVTSEYLVRASNAHSWVEAYFPGYGWASFDPTPAVPPQPRAGWSRVMLYVDALSSFWREWVISYDIRHQYTLGRQATWTTLQWYQHAHFWMRRRYAAMLTAARQAQFALSDSPMRWTVAGALLTGLLVLAANLGRFWRAVRRRRLAARPERGPQAAATIWYERMTRMLAHRGWHKLPGQTPGEFTNCFADSAMHDSVSQFTRHYERARFGGSVEDARELPGLYQVIAAAVRR